MALTPWLISRRFRGQFSLPPPGHVARANHDVVAVHAGQQGGQVTRMDG